MTTVLVNTLTARSSLAERRSLWRLQLADPVFNLSNCSRYTGVHIETKGKCPRASPKGAGMVPLHAVSSGRSIPGARNAAPQSLPVVPLEQARR